MSGFRAGFPRLCALSTLLPELSGGQHAGLRIGGLCLDSRRVVPGDAFIALGGAHEDGERFIVDAANRGAVAALVEAGRAPGTRAHGLPVLAVNALAERIAGIAAQFYDDPSASMPVIGVTGTNGKTTCTQLIAQALTLLGKPCGVIGTLGWGFPGTLADTGMTTPDAVTVQRVLAELRAQAAQYAVMEVSSHALKQGRPRAVHFASAVFTNLSHDHLDYHGSLEDYGASKRLLFESAGLGHAVLNVDDAFGQQLMANLPAGPRLIGYGLEPGPAHVTAGAAQYRVDGLCAWVETPWGKGELRTPLLGRFNLANALAVLCVLCLHGFALADVLGVFPRLRPVPGRMERISSGTDPLVIVDYAHTPDALEQSLRALRPHCGGRLWCVFGCGGDRDRTKRPLMGRIAWEHADELVLTSDNPRSEAPEAIIDEILTGVPGDGVRREANRERAIGIAIGAAQPGDCVLIAGKGHERYQECNGVRTPFSDAEAARRALRSTEGAS